ncbi:MAG: 50S ribosomal protein L24 [Acidiferrobacteraceae bacterium]
MRKIRKGDRVIVRKGRSRGKQGTVLRVLEDGRAVVENVNLVKKHLRPNPQRNVTGGVVDREAPIAIANLALFNPADQKGSRIGVRTLDDGRKVRYFKRGGEVVDA